MGRNPRPSNKRPKPPHSPPPPRRKREDMGAVIPKIVPPPKDIKCEGRWQCEYCGTENDSDIKRCEECGAPRKASGGYGTVYAPYLISPDKPVV